MMPKLKTVLLGLVLGGTATLRLSGCSVRECDDYECGSSVTLTATTGPIGDDTWDITLCADEKCFEYEISAKALTADGGVWGVRLSEDGVLSITKDLMGIPSYNPLWSLSVVNQDGKVIVEGSTRVKLKDSSDDPCQACLYGEAHIGS